MVAIADAAEFFRARGVTIVVHSADPLTTAALNGTAQPGVIAILPGSLAMRPGQRAHGETRHAVTVGGDIYGAEVTLASCDVQVVAHELGHALGLVHVPARGNLMHAELGLGGWELSGEQVAWVGD